MQERDPRDAMRVPSLYRQPKPIEIKGLAEKLGVDEQIIEELKASRLENIFSKLRMQMQVVQRGGNLNPPVTPEERARRRAKAAIGRKTNLRNRNR